MTQYAKVVTTDGIQQVELPEGFHIDASELEISREGDRIVLKPREQPATGDPWKPLKDLLANGFSEDFFANGREQPDKFDERNFGDVFK